MGLSTESGGKIIAMLSALPTLLQRIHIVLNKDSFVSSDQQNWSISRPGSYGTPHENIFLFSTGTPGGERAQYAFYCFKIREAGVLVKDFVPCTLTENIPAGLAWDNQAHQAGENGMWDKVGMKFHGNANSNNQGSFTVIA